MLETPLILTVETEVEQLALFTTLNPLKERFTSAFYREIPRTPGIYWMLDEHGTIIYVGKAKNLRQRLRSYRQLIFDRQSRKTRRLLVSIRRIHWMEHADETAALLAENEALRTLKPRYNIANTEPESYAYLAMRVRDGEVRLRLNFDPSRAGFEPDEVVAGPFKGVARLRRVHASFARWLWSVAKDQGQWPPPLARSLSAPLFLTIPLETPCDHVEISAKAFLMGLAPLPELVLPEEEPAPWHQSLWREDQSRLAQFFNSCERLRALRHKTGRERGVIAREEIDDLIVLASRERRERRGRSADDTPTLLPLD